MNMQGFIVLRALNIDEMRKKYYYCHLLYNLDY